MSKYAIPELVDERRRLGRNHNHDPMSRRYAIRAEPSTHETTRWERRVPIFTQRKGSCTCQSGVGALGSTPHYDQSAVVMKAKGYGWDQTFIEDVLYHLVTSIDPYSGIWPPDDTGSDGLSAMKGLQQLGLNNGYVHALSLDALLTGLQSSPGIIGVNWYDSFDDPAEDGTLSFTAGARVRGGHELEILNVDMQRERLQLPNSWGKGWGLSGYCWMPFAVAERLLAEDGDATFPVPLAAPAPEPAPIVVEPLQAVRDFYSLAGSWSTARHSGANKVAANGAKVLFQRTGVAGPQL